MPDGRVEYVHQHGAVFSKSLNDPFMTGRILHPIDEHGEHLRDCAKIHPEIPVKHLAFNQAQQREHHNNSDQHECIRRMRKPGEPHYSR